MMGIFGGLGGRLSFLRFDLVLETKFSATARKMIAERSVGMASFSH